MAEVQKGVKFILRKESVKNGIFFGVAVLALNIFSFYLTTSFTTSPMLIIGGSILLAYLIPFILSIYFGFILKNRTQASTFRQLVTGIFIMMVTCYFIFSVGQDLVFAKLIEPDMSHKTEIAMENSERIQYKSQGLSQSQINDKVAEKQKMFNSENQATFEKIIMHYAIYVILLFALSIIVTLIIKGGVRTSNS